MLSLCCDAVVKLRRRRRAVRSLPCCVVVTESSSCCDVVAMLRCRRRAALPSSSSCCAVVVVLRYRRRASLSLSCFTMPSSCYDAVVMRRAAWSSSCCDGVVVLRCCRYAAMPSTRTCTTWCWRAVPGFRGRTLPRFRGNGDTVRRDSNRDRRAPRRAACHSPRRFRRRTPGTYSVCYE